MQSKVRKRKSFLDVDLGKTAYLEYEKYDWLPSSEDFEYGEERSIVLRNKSSGELEQIDYVLSGGVRSATRPGYCWFWGDVISDDYNCCLVFNYDSTGKCDKVTISFCGKSPDCGQFKEITKGTWYPAGFTAKDPFNR